MILDQIRLEDINQELKMGNRTQKNNKKTNIRSIKLIN